MAKRKPKNCAQPQLLQPTPVTEPNASPQPTELVQQSNSQVGNTVNLEKQTAFPLDRQRRAAYNHWRTSLKCRKLRVSGPNSLHHIWAEGLKLLETNYGELHGSMLADLVDDQTGGRFILDRTISTTLNHGDWKYELTLYEALLKVITHPSFLSLSTASNDHLALLYTLIGEEDGVDGIKWLIKLTGHFNRLQGLRVHSLVFVTAKALKQLLNRYPSLKYDDRLHALRDRLHQLLDLTATPSSKQSTKASATATRSAAAPSPSNTTDHLPKAVGKAKQLPIPNKHPQLVIPNPAAKPGGRHDNDHIAIANIQILPTYGEIMSEQLEFLPTTDFTKQSFLKDTRQRYIDTLFRLYRHNTFSAIKDFLRDQLSYTPAENSTNGNPSDIGRNGVAHFYSEATIDQLGVGFEDGVWCVISFLQLPHLQKLSRKAQAEWWVKSSRLEPGKLLALVVPHRGTKRLLYLVGGDEYEERHLSSKFKERKSGKRPTAQFKLAQATEENIVLLNELHGSRTKGHLFELCGLIPQSYEPTLANIQRMSKDSHLAFQEWIIPTLKNSNKAPTIPPPKYARKPSFMYRLDCVNKDKQSTGLTLNPNKAPKAKELAVVQRATGLNASQVQALVAALSQEFVQIQGPPGTGKTYVGLQIVKVLVEHKATCQLSPLLIVCETNHALDQFGEHILEAGIKDIIRVGSRSKSKALEKHNLALLRRQRTTKGEKQSKRLVREQMNAASSRARICLSLIQQATAGRPNWSLIKNFLSNRYPRIHSQLKPADAEGFTLVGDPIINWLGQRPAQLTTGSKAKALVKKAGANTLSLTVHERWALADHWCEQFVHEQTHSLMEHLQKAQKHRQDLSRVNADINCRLLKGADVVLMTTSRLAFDNRMLRRMKPKVIICEEAAEVMEPRMMAAFFPGVEHLIQIGDHQQLRPMVQDTQQFSMETNVGKHYQLDRSLFERRVSGEPGMKPLPVIQLNEQQRMPPEISALIRNNVYKDLRDGSSVMNRPMVAGLRERLFWWDHDYEEGMGLNAAQAMSYTNSKEVEMATALVRHLVRQGVYEGKDIAILTPYAGQLLKLQEALDEHFEVVLSERDEERLGAQGFDKTNKVGDYETKSQTLLPSGKMQMKDGIRLATVDGFQGEQAKVIIISLVRSNKKSKVGFLRLKNRINVLLSRVQHGMYLIGNSATFPAVDMWKDVYRQISARKAAGPSLPLCCPRHPKTLMNCTSSEDFVSFSPEGGCTRNCADKLPVCGHPCPNKCHSEMLHKAVVCPKPCPRVRKTCKHACAKVCGRDCGKCMVIVDDTTLPCGHIKDKLLCYQLLDLESVICRVKVEKQVPACGHTVTVNCSTDVSSSRFSCEARCHALLPCNHKCQGTCWLCRTYDDGRCIAVEHRTCDICKPSTWGLGDIERMLAFVDRQLRQSGGLVQVDNVKPQPLEENSDGEDQPLTPENLLSQGRYESCYQLMTLCQETQERIEAHDSLTAAMNGLSLDHRSELKAQDTTNAIPAQLKLLGARLVEHKCLEAILRNNFRLWVKKMLDERDKSDLTPPAADTFLERLVASFLGSGTALLNECSKAKLPRLAFIATILYARVALMVLLYRQCLVSGIDGDGDGDLSDTHIDGREASQGVKDRLERIFKMFVTARELCEESSVEDADLIRCLQEVLMFSKRPMELTLKEVVEAIGEAPLVFVSRLG